MQVEYNALYVHDEDLQTLARSALEANRPAGFVPLNGQVSVDFVTQPVLQADDAAIWKASASRELEAEWNNQSAARSVVGMVPLQAAAFLEKNLTLARAPRILLSPDWWIRMPFFAYRIEVVRR
jgi:hypothetical protein